MRYVKALTLNATTLHMKQPYKVCKKYLQARQTCNRNQTCQGSVIATWRLGLQSPFVAHNKYRPQNRLLRGNLNEVNFNTQQD